MPKSSIDSKNPLDRYRKLNGLLNEATSTGRPISSEWLAKKLGVSERQLRTDRAFFRDVLNAPLRWDERQNGWIYDEQFAFIDRFGMTTVELQQLRIALQMLTQQEGLASRFGLLNGIAERLEERVGRIPTRPTSSKILFFENQHKYKGAGHLPFFLDAIEKTWRVEFDFHPYGQPVRRVVFEPHFLKHWEGKWYVGGQSLADDEREFIRVYPLERIEGEAVKTGEAKIEQLQSPEKYWENIYGINDPRENKTVETVRLRFSNFYKNYFLDAPFFEPFEVIEEDADTLMVEMRLKINWELRRKLASFGKEVTVLGPPRLIDDMRTFLSDTLGNYCE